MYVYFLCVYVCVCKRMYTYVNAMRICIYLCLQILVYLSSFEGKYMHMYLYICIDILCIFKIM